MRVKVICRSDQPEYSWSPGERLAVTQTAMKNQQQKLAWKARNNNYNDNEHGF